MSLFSVVQNRIPPPPMPQPQMEQPQMAASVSAMPSVPADPTTAPNGASMPGFIDGGVLGFAGGDKPGPVVAGSDADKRRDERMVEMTRHYLNLDNERPGFENGGNLPLPGFGGGGDYNWYDPDTSGGGSGEGGGGTGKYGPGAINNVMNEQDEAFFSRTGQHMTVGDAEAALDEYYRMRDDERAYEAAGGGSGGADHFYEQMAENARIRAEERRDAMQVANVTQMGEAEVAQQRYKTDLIAAENERKQLMNSAVGQAQDSYAKLLSQADPNQGAIYRQPNQGVEAMKNTQGPSWAAPVIPRTVFPEGW